MTEDRGTAGKAGNRVTPFSKLSLEAQGEQLFKFNSKDQADSYLCAKKKTADHLGVELGWDIRQLIKDGTEPTFKAPKQPTNDALTKTPGALKMWEVKYAMHCKKEEEFKEKKSVAFLAILERCSTAMRTHIESDAGYKTLEKERNVVGLLDKMKTAAFSAGGVQHPFWILVYLLKKLVNMNQGPTETVENYHQRIDASKDVIGLTWGILYPPELIESKSEADKKKANEQLMAMIFLSGADKKRYGKLVEELNNAYLAKKDNYPESLDAALTLGLTILLLI